jgi:hypothetical protein
MPEGLHDAKFLIEEEHVFAVQRFCSQSDGHQELRVKALPDLILRQRSQGMVSRQLCLFLYVTQRRYAEPAPISFHLYQKPSNICQD